MSVKVPPVTFAARATIDGHAIGLTAGGSQPPPNMRWDNLNDSFVSSPLDNDTRWTFNDSSQLPGQFQEESLVTQVIRGLAMTLVMVAAVFGNSLVIVSVFRVEKLRIIANSFIVSLAFADLLVAILVMPFSASIVIAGKWVFGPLYCDIFNANDVLFSTASLLHLCCISMDRYIAIMDPFHYESKMTGRRVALMLLCAWGASALISHIPIQAGWYTTAEYRDAIHNNTDECLFRVNKVYGVVSSSISFWTPTVIMVFTYMKIYREASRQAKQIQQLSYVAAPSLENLNSVTRNGNAHGNHSYSAENVKLSQERKKMKREHKAAKTLGIIMGAFLLCWLPFFTWYITTTMCDHCYTPPVVEGLLFWIGYANSALNPLIYAFFNRDFRNAFKKLLRCNRSACCCCCCCCRRRCCGCCTSGPESHALALYPTETRTRLSRPSTNSSTNTPSPRRTPPSYESVN